MEFKDLEEAKKYVDVLLKEKTDLTNKNVELEKNLKESTEKNLKIQETNSKLMEDIVNMKTTTTPTKEEDDKTKVDNLFLHDDVTKDL